MLLGNSIVAVTFVMLGHDFGKSVGKCREPIWQTWHAVPTFSFLKHCRLEHTNRRFERDTQNANLSNVRDLNDKRLPSMPLVKGDMVSKQTGIIYNSFRHFKTSASRD